ncbi:hypothetical protein [Streptomyces sp. NPDC001743]|uniref:hypothetical protein n=1 Tax=Streptomyces sp. NPDC001743 TaxID=3154397 RepID=UPI00332A0244
MVESLQHRTGKRISHPLDEADWETVKVSNRKFLTGMTALASATLVTVSSGSAHAAIKPGTISTVKVSSKTQKVTSGVAGIDLAGKDTCKAGAAWNARVYWTLGKVTTSKIQVKSVKLTYSVGPGRKLTVSSLGLIDGSGKQKWSKYSPYGKPLTGLVQNKSNAVNKTVSGTKKKRVALVVRASLSGRKSGEMSWCTPDSLIYFYLQQNR